VLSEGQLGLFEDWELGTRGYRVWPYRVDLEPPYSPLLNRLRTNPAGLDDGRRPGLFQTWQTKPQQELTPTAPDQALAPSRSMSPSQLEIQLVLPEGFVVKASLARELLTSFQNLSSPLSFELLGLHEGIIVQLSYAEADDQVVQATLGAFFPEVRLRHRQNLLASQWFSAARYATLIDFGLYEPVYRQLKADSHLETDPLIAIVGALNDLEPGELGLLQVLFQPAIAPWGRDLWHFASSVDEAKDLLSLVEAKFAQPLHASVIRVAALSATADSAFERARALGNALLAATQSGYNNLFPLDNEGYPDPLHEEDILDRTSHRSGMILSNTELLTLVHLPSAMVRSKRLVRQQATTKAAPALTHQGSTSIGINKHDDEQRSVFLSTEHRLRHTYVIGASGTGKSNLLLSMILQDIDQGHGVAVLDPHGDLVEDVLARIPIGRAGDVALIDPSDAEYPVGFNVLSAHSDLEQTLLSSDLVGVFRRLSTSWGDQMTAVFGNAILAFLESTRGGTLLDLRRFLIEADFRRDFLETVTDQEVRYFWQQEFPLLKGIPQAPLLTRLDAFLRPKSIRYMVAQKQDRLDFRSIMDKGNILLAKLSQGAIGDENSYLLGSLLCARLSQAAASRQEQDTHSRKPFFVYLDEFHNFITPSLAQLVSGVRKYAVGLTLAHQDLRQMKSRSEDVASAVLTNPCTRIVFRVGEQDASALADGLHSFEAKDLQNLGLGQAIARVERASFDFNLETIRVTDQPSQTATAARSATIESSRNRYATPLAEVEAALTTQSPKAAASPGIQAKADPERPAAEAPRIVPPAKRPDAVPARRPPEETKPEGVLSGRGGPQHKYLQALLKRAAEDRGYRVTLEKRVLDGAGHIDVALERDELTIACEVHITTPQTKELANLSKCLAAGFDYAVLVSSDKRVLARAEQEMTTEMGQPKDKLRFLTPEAFFAFLEEVEATLSETSNQVRGYKVKVKFRALSEEDKEARQKLIADVVSRSLKRSKK